MTAVNPDIKKIAAPIVLRKSVQAYRDDSGYNKMYILRLPKDNETLQVEQWKFFVLEVLPECANFKALSSVVKDRFGHAPQKKDVDAFFSLLERKQFFGAPSLELPILNSIHHWGSVRLDQTAQAGESGAQALKTSGAKSQPHTGPKLAALGAGTTESGATGSKPPAGADPMDEVAGVAGAVGLDDSKPQKGFRLFNPTRLLMLLSPVMWPLRHALLLLPVLLGIAVIICLTKTTALGEDVIYIFKAMSFAKHALLAMLTVNLAATMLSAVVAYHFRASVNSFRLVFYMLFLPRFSVQISNAGELSRRELIWLHASPLLLRLGFFSAGILLWYFSRVRYEFLAFYGLSIASIGAISFLITVNPLIKSSGFHLLAAFANEPHLRGKSFHAFMNKFGGKIYSNADQNVLAAYALASMLFTLAFIACLIYILKGYLNIYIGKGSLIVFLVLGALLAWRVISKCRKIEKQYELSVQYLKWRNRTLPQNDTDMVKKRQSSKAIVYVKRIFLASLVAAMFIPYKYEVGGNFKVLPFMQQKIATDIAGIIEDVYFDGGEFVKKGTVIGHLSHSEYDAQEKTYAAKVTEQEAIIEELKNKPRPEELQVALDELETQRTRALFSRAKTERLQTLYRRGAISLEDLEDARRNYEVDTNLVKEKTSNYELIKAGATPNEIAAAEAKLKAYQEQQDYYRERIEKSTFSMPFNGKIVTMHLKDKIGSYLNKGEALSMVEYLKVVKAEIEVPESDIDFVKPQAVVRLRSRVDHTQNLVGTVLSVNQNVTEQRYGRVINVITLVNNTSDLFKTGMTGYAKIESRTMPLGKVLAMPLIRFASVDIWSWLP